MKNSIFQKFLCTIFALIFIQTSLSAYCACIQKDGHCECPKGHCACIECHGQCQCHQSFEAGVNQSYVQNFQNVDTSSSYNYTYQDSYENNNECCVNEESCCIVPLPQHQLYIGPEIYHVNRKRDNGSKQNGWVYGGRVGYDRIKRCRIYWGVEGLYATGRLHGHTGARSKIKSCYTDASIEGRLGYTIQLKSCSWLPTLVPFGGYGYLREMNKFKVSHIKFTTQFDYVTAGFLSQFYPNPCWVVGLNFKARFLFNSKCKISDRDPDQQSFSQNFEHKVQYRVELPITYRLNCWCDRLAIVAVPFYEFRHYGFQSGFPDDFHGTKLNLYGIDIRFMYMF